MLSVIQTVIFWIYEIFLYHSFWYIQFIMFVFLCLPLYLKFIELRKPWVIFSVNDFT